MRNIEDYARKYQDELGFEAVKVLYRRKMILELIERKKPKRILEIGCGLEPLAKYIRTERGGALVLR